MVGSWGKLPGHNRLEWDYDLHKRNLKGVDCLFPHIRTQQKDQEPRIRNSIDTEFANALIFYFLDPRAVRNVFVVCKFMVLCKLTGPRLGVKPTYDYGPF